MSGPRFSEHDREVIADVAAFCGVDTQRRLLVAVWIGDGWAIGTDSYRLDAREVDTTWSGAINPCTFEPIRFDRDFDARWMALRTSPRHDVTGRKVSLADLPDAKTRKGKYRRICLDCFAYSTEASSAAAMAPCACPAPLVELSYLRQAVAHFENPVSLRWEVGESRLGKAVRLDEDEHFHLLMTVRRSSTW